LKTSREDSGQAARLVVDNGNGRTARKEDSQMADEERYESKEDKGKDVEGHKHKVAMTDEPVQHDEGEDVEAHRHKLRHKEMSTEPGQDDDSDDVEAHIKKASHKAL